jgi:RinA family phage transcriptional activator
MGIIKVRKGTFKHIESELFAYHDTRKEIIRLRNDIMYPSKQQDDNTGGGRGSMTSDPTGRAVIALSANARLVHMEALVHSIECVYERLPEDKKRLINLYYWSRPQLLSWEGIAQQLHINRATAFRWRDEIIYALTDRIGWR